MERLNYTLTISIDPNEVEPETYDELLDAAEPHDTDDGLARWLGDKLSDAEDHLNSTLPEGFSAKIGEAP